MTDMITGIVFLVLFLLLTGAFVALTTMEGLCS